MGDKRPRKLTITQQIMQEVEKQLKSKNYPNEKTYKTYLHHARRYVQFCRENYNCRSYEDCSNLEYAQGYCDALKENYAPSSIHLFMVSVTSAFNLPLRKIDKPIRHTAEYTRGRKEKFTPQAAEDLNDPRWNYIVEFQKRGALRRMELLRLCGRNFKQDESGYWCIEVEKGKGSKYQLNRLNSEEDVEFIRKYFEAVKPDEKIFPPELFRNRLNLHKLRADSAREFYFQNLKKLQENPAYAEQMEREIRARWEKYNIDKRTGEPKKFNPEKYRGYHVLRGKNRELAMKNGMPGKYHKLCLLYTSIMKLSHWRCSVAVNSYINIDFKN